MLFQLSLMFDNFKSQINKEISTALNIKDKTNKKNVIFSLKLIANYLKKIKGNYIENGSIIYSGILNNNEIVFEVIEIDIPIKNKLYYCDKVFHTQFLDKYICLEKEVYLVMFLNGDHTYYYEKYLTEMKLIKQISFDRQKKQKKGGQSAPRIGRICMEKIESFINKSIDGLNLYINNDKQYESIIIAGNGDIINGIKSKVNDNNINYLKLVNKDLLYSECELLINSINGESDKNKIDEYMELITSDYEIVVFGLDSIIDNINNIKEIVIHKKSKYYNYVKDYPNIYVINNNGIDFLNNYDGIIGQLYNKNLSLYFD